MLSLLASIFAGGETARRAAVEGMASRSLSELALLAGMRDDRGEPLRAEPLEVTVVQGSGETWIREAVSDAVDGVPDFAVGDSPHLLRIELVEAKGVIALQLRLWRQGWDLRTPGAIRIRMAPWAGVFAGVLGAFLGFAGWRVGIGTIAAGLLAQAMVQGLPWPAETIAPLAWSEDVQSGPLVGGVVAFTRTFPDWGMPAAVAFVVFCVVLIGFDHRRSQGRSDALPLASVVSTTVLVGGGSLLWLEAAMRAGLWSSMHSLPGALAALFLALAWVPAIRRTRERMRV